MSETEEEDIYYAKWKTHKGSGIKVTKLRFLTYATKNGGKLFFVDDEDKKRFCCEIWLCKLPDGTKQALKFRNQCEDDLEGNVGWSYNKYPPVFDRSVNYHFDTWEEILGGKLLDINPRLDEWKQKQAVINKQLRKDGSTLSKLRLTFRNSPTRRVWDKICREREKLRILK